MEKFYKIGLAVFALIFIQSISYAQLLHPASCSAVSTSFSLDWSSAGGANQYLWTSVGATSYSITGIAGSSYDVNFIVTGSTSTLATEGGSATPSVNSTLSGGEQALHISSSGLDTNEYLQLEMQFSPAVAGVISFDIYNIIQNGTVGQSVTVFAKTSSNNIIIPQLSSNGSPSWDLDGPGVVNGNSASTSGTNDQVGVSFNSFEDVTSVFVKLKRCITCSNAANTEFAIGDIDFCLVPDQDQDGVADVLDDDADNDGIPNSIEQCSSNAIYTFNWSNYTWPNNTTYSQTFAMPDGTNFTASAITNGATLTDIDIDNSFEGGFGSAEKSWFILADQTNPSQSVDVIFDFDQALDSLSFTIFDVDYAVGDFTDSLIVIGYYSGYVVFPTLTASANNSVSNNRVVGTSSTSSTSNAANVGVHFSAPVDSVTIYYGNGNSAPFSPGDQAISIYDLVYLGNCGSTDADNDGIEDYLDIDADNDGIVDNIELQSSSTSIIAPSGVDTDDDGIDNNFETPISPRDTDGDSIPDYKDTDSDNDGELDVLEAWDTDNDGTANTLASGVDTDGDGLDDAFDLVSGLNPTTNITNDGQVAFDFPNVETALTLEPDWREAPLLGDADADGINDLADLDVDNDGIINSLEGCFLNDTIDWDDVSFTSSPAVYNTSYYTITQLISSDGGTPSNAVNMGQTGGLSPMENAFQSGVDNTTVTQKTTITFAFDNPVDMLEFTIFDIDRGTTACGLLGLSTCETWQDKVTVTAYLNGDAVSNPVITTPGIVNISSNVMIGTANVGPTSNAGNATVMYATLLDSVVITHGNDALDGTTNPAFQVIAIHDLFFSGVCDQDTDGDGILDYKDIDSDNDGISDIIENHGSDTDNDGRVDYAVSGWPSTMVDTDNNGLADVYDSDNGGASLAQLDTDNDGVINALDLDSDNDGILDLHEFELDSAMLIALDANKDGVIDSGFGANGFSNALETSIDAGFSVFSAADADADGLLNSEDLDSDNDGLTDVFENQFLNTFDANLDGIIDGTTDADGDGILASADAIDAVFGSTGSFPVDSDGDHVYDAYDIDADNDGITDNTEAQATATYASPSGADADSDGLDDQYDVDCAPCGAVSGFAVVAINTDNSDNPDYLDLDSDSDGESDLIEGHDSEGDGIADLGSPANTGVSGATADVDGDGLLDGWDNDTLSADPTNGGLEPSSFPNADLGNTELDWRETPCNDGVVMLAPSNATTVASGACNASQYTYYYNPLMPSQLLFAIEHKPVGGNTADFEAEVSITTTSDPSSMNGVLSATDSANSTATFVMGRYYNFNITSGSLDGPVNIRFFYNPAEIDSLEAAALDWKNNVASAGAVVSGVRWFQMNSGTFDPNSADLQPSGILDSRQVYAIIMATEDGVDYIQMENVSSLTGGGVAYTVGVNSVVLPVELISFSAEKFSQNDASILWSTVSEKNCDYFEIQRSTDLLTWQKVGIQKGAGNSNVQIDYQMIDRNVLSSRIYYRLKQVDFDGQSTLSAVRQLDFSNQKLPLVLYPNPSNGTLYIDFNSDQIERVEVYNMLGQKVAEFENQQSLVTLENLAAGSYNVIVYSDLKTEALPLIVNN